MCVAVFCVASVALSAHAFTSPTYICGSLADWTVVDWMGSRGTGWTWPPLAWRMQPASSFHNHIYGCGEQLASMYPSSPPPPPPEKEEERNHNMHLMPKRETDGNRSRTKAGRDPGTGESKAVSTVFPSENMAMPCSMLTSHLSQDGVLCFFPTDSSLLPQNLPACHKNMHCIWTGREDWWYSIVIISPCIVANQLNLIIVPCCDAWQLLPWMDKDDAPGLTQPYSELKRHGPAHTDRHSQITPASVILTWTGFTLLHVSWWPEFGFLQQSQSSA